jgi:BirA family biotin operon repressor/biotin-[acetyl-CoA-carboxylase] ligase
VIDLKWKFLDILADKEFHSIESLSRELDVSSRSVENYFSELQRLGVPLYSKKTHGFALTDDADLLCKSIIMNYLSNYYSATNIRLEVLQILDSTNRYAREQAENFSCPGLVVLAEMQTAGRGRRGKTWVSPFAANIYMSLVWDFPQGAQALEGLSLAIGVAVRRALIKLDISGIQLKWPNDIFFKGRKLGGILLEMIGDINGACSVIVGVGLNVSMADSYVLEIDQEWTDLSRSSKVKISRNQLTAILIIEIFNVLVNFQEIGFKVYRDEWQNSDLLCNQAGTIKSVNESISGTVLGVDNSGALRMLLSNGEERRFIGGELSLRASE